MCGTVTGNCGWFCSLPSCRLYLQIVIWHHCSLDGNALLGLVACEFLIAQELRVVSMCGILTLLEKRQMKHFQMRSKKCTTYLISNLLSCSVGMRSHFDVNLSFIASKLYSVSSCWSKQASSLIYGATRRWFCLFGEGGETICCLILLFQPHIVLSVLLKCTHKWDIWYLYLCVALNGTTVANRVWVPPKTGLLESSISLQTCLTHSCPFLLQRQFACTSCTHSFEVHTR